MSRLRTVLIPDPLQARTRAVECLRPGGWAEVRPWIGRIDDVVGAFADALLADQRLREAMRMMHIVEAESALHA